MAAAPTVFTTPFPQSWRADVPAGDELTQLAAIGATAVNAYVDSAGAPRDLTLGATTNVRVEAVNAIDLYAGDRGSVNIYDTTVDPATGERTDTLIFGVSRDRVLDRTTIDASDALQLGDLVVTKDVESLVANVSTATMTQGIRFLRDVQVAGKQSVLDTLSVGGHAVVSGSVFSKGDLFGKNYNLFKESNVATPDASRVGYAFTINAEDQLELL